MTMYSSSAQLLHWLKFCRLHVFTKITTNLPWLRLVNCQTPATVRIHFRMPTGKKPSKLCPVCTMDEIHYLRVQTPTWPTDQSNALWGQRAMPHLRRLRTQLEHKVRMSSHQKEFEQ